MTATQPDPRLEPSIPSRVVAPRFVGAGLIETWERDVPRPGRGQLLLRVRANAICGTDREAYLAGSTGVPGHEAAGEIAAAGEGTATAVGTPGVVFLMDYCGACRSCVAGATNQCLAKRGDMGFTHDGGYGPYELIHESNFFPIPDDLPFAEATLLLDVMGTTGHALMRARLVTRDVRAVAVSGAGPLGLGFAVMVRLLLGPDVPVVVADIQSARLELIRALGARAVDLRKEQITDGLRAIGLAEVDVAIDTAGKSASRRALLDIVAKRGVLVCVGHGEGLDLTVSPDLIAPERAVLGSEYFRYDELPGNLALLRANLAILSRIITHRFPVDELSAAFQVFMSGVTGKVVVEQ